VAVLALHVLEGGEVAARRVAGLGSRDVEADDALVAEVDGQLGDLERPGACRIAVSRLTTRIGPAAQPSR
jgi:hypothetical protein